MAAVVRKARVQLAASGIAMTWGVVGQVADVIAALALPIVLAVLGYKLSRRLKAIDASQWRNQELIKARLEAYRQLAPLLNDLLCYFTFIGRWKDFSPPEVVKTKRSLDREFHVALPLFSNSAGEAYREFMDSCFATFGMWGEDAKLRTSFKRRRDVAGDRWDDTWVRYFDTSFSQGHSAEDLLAIRASYDRILQSLVNDIQLLESRDRYATNEVSWNA